MQIRHLIEAKGLGEKLFAAVNEHLSAKGIKVGTGTIMDATIIAAASSPMNADGTRDPEMHQTKEGNQWYFGMKAHIGADSKIKIVHAVTATPANVHDSRAIPDILHGNETRVWGDSAAQGQGEGEPQSGTAGPGIDTSSWKPRLSPQQGSGRLRNGIKRVSSTNNDTDGS